VPYVLAVLLFLGLVSLPLPLLPSNDAFRVFPLNLGWFAICRNSRYAFHTDSHIPPTGFVITFLRPYFCTGLILVFCIRPFEVLGGLELGYNQVSNRSVYFSSVSRNGHYLCSYPSIRPNFPTQFYHIIELISFLNESVSFSNDASVTESRRITFFLDSERGLSSLMFADDLLILRPQLVSGFLQLRRHHLVPPPFICKHHAISSTHYHDSVPCPRWPSLPEGQITPGNLFRCFETSISPTWMGLLPRFLLLPLTSSWFPAVLNSPNTYCYLEPFESRLQTVSLFAPSIQRRDRSPLLMWPPRFVSPSH